MACSRIIARISSTRFTPLQLPSPTTNKLLGGFVNGWQVSGVLQLESGPNLTGFQNQNFGMNLQ